MEPEDAIRYVARAEARRAAGRARIVEGDATVPLLRVERNPSTKAYRASFACLDGHPAAYRAPDVVAFLEREVLPRIDPEVDASCTARFELHDAYRLKAGADPDAAPLTLCFARDLTADGERRVAPGAALFPDHYHMLGYGDLLGPAHCNRSRPWFSKRDVVAFAGTTTGDLDPAKNARVQACLWALDKRPRFDLRLTSVRQMTVDALAQHCGIERLQRIVGPYLQPLEHEEFKYVLNVQGNTCCWSRVPMILNSGSLMLNLRHAEGTWYYPLLHAGTHYVDVPSLDALPGVVDRCDADPRECQRLVANAHAFVDRFCTKDAAAEYARWLLQGLAEEKN